MLASTVQFSNNDQPPITPPLQVSALGPATKGTDSNEPVPSDTQQRARPDQPVSVFHAEAVLTKTCSSCRIVNVPPLSNHRRTFADEMVSGFPEGNLDAP
jgi:hypothetical protein